MAMPPNQQPIIKDLVLIGGGHSHVAVLKRFGMKPLPGVRLTLIARDVHTPYSGMLPGLIAGHYGFDDAHVDLRPLCQFAGARLFHDEAVRLDLDERLVHCAGRPPVPYDLLSVDVGSRPRIADVPGAESHATAVKPIDRFVARWARMERRVLDHPGPHRIGVVGGGAAGVEVLLAIQFRLSAILAAAGRGADGLEFHLICGSGRVMPAFPEGVSRRFARVLAERGVRVHHGSAAASVADGTVTLGDGGTLALDEILWATGASAVSWLAESGLAVDQDGFVRVHDTLQSTSHPEVFAAGDIAAVVGHPRPKAGVFAVRQGRPLADNLRRALLGQTPRPFAPQKKFLALVSTGDKYAVASRGRLVVAGEWVWTWKDWIDRRWMRKYADLPEMKTEQGPALDPGLADQDTLKEISAIAMRCGGCGAKVGATVLTRALAGLKPVPREDVLIGLHEPDDAAVVMVPPGKVVVHSVDYFRSFIDDPFIFGQVAANHCLSDLFAMAAEPQSALAIATVPYGIERKVEETLSQLMAGGMKILEDAGAALVGGHTSEGAELGLGFSVNGLADRDALMRKGGMRAGDALILTKALGTGTLFAADMLKKAKGRWINGALESMVQSNRRAAAILHGHGARACTDVTGFGLLGHLVEMIRPSGVDVEIDLRALPILDGALECTRRGILSSLQPANLRLRRGIRNIAEAAKSELYPLVFDPQTSGGLLASIPAERADDCVAALRAQGYGRAAIIGRVKEEGDALEPVIMIA